jgi:hypothetical protein
MVKSTLQLVHVLNSQELILNLQPFSLSVIHNTDKGLNTLFIRKRTKNCH